ncbi:MAG: hypothetical protein CMC59_07650 [Flavobacteriaceae bacterium]|nr:hypothetical protein [Flavobacteriaceae bacterium]|tara:strand:+ start:605 stop:1186 length:582 start_codon:yes stop_codon:yes gene_type:complete
MAGILKVDTIQRAGSDSDQITLSSSGVNLFNPIIKSGSGTTGMTIDTSGIIVQPTKPLFSGKLTSRMTISGSGHTQITGISEDFDQGNNHSSGTFTCPIAGKYRVHCSGSYRSDGASYVDLRIDQNSTYIARSYSELPNAAQVRGANAWHPFSCENIVNAAVGDTFKWYLGAGAGTSQLLETPYTRFSVEFIG